MKKDDINQRQPTLLEQALVSRGDFEDLRNRLLKEAKDHRTIDRDRLGFLDGLTTQFKNSLAGDDQSWLRGIEVERQKIHDRIYNTPGKRLAKFLGNQVLKPLGTSFNKWYQLSKAYVSKQIRENFPTAKWAVGNILQKPFQKSKNILEPNNEKPVIIEAKKTKPSLKDFFNRPYRKPFNQASYQLLAHYLKDNGYNDAATQLAEALLSGQRDFKIRSVIDIKDETSGHYFDMAVDRKGNLVMKSQHSVTANPHLPGQYTTTYIDNSSYGLNYQEATKLANGGTVVRAGQDKDGQSTLEVLKPAATSTANAIKVAEGLVDADAVQRGIMQMAWPPGTEEAHKQHVVDTVLKGEEVSVILAKGDQHALASISLDPDTMLAYKDEHGVSTTYLKIINQLDNQVQQKLQAAPNQSQEQQAATQQRSENRRPTEKKKLASVKRGNVKRSASRQYISR